MNKFDGTKPLLKFGSDNYPRKLDLRYNYFEAPKKFDLYIAMEGEAIEEKAYEIVFGCKAIESDLLKFDFLNTFDGPAFIAHGRVIERLTEMCPGDFQAFPIEIKNDNPKNEDFINRDYYLINITHVVDAIDKEHSEIDWREDYPNLSDIRRLTLKEDCMEGHFLARDQLDRTMILVDPKLAKEFRKSKGIQFLADEEKPI